jgi:hypothetical protein
VHCFLPIACNQEGITEPQRALILLMLPSSHVPCPPQAQNEALKQEVASIREAELAFMKHWRQERWVGLRAGVRGQGCGGCYSMWPVALSTVSVCAPAADRLLSSIRNTR